ncbi:MAG: MBOAT family protein [Sphingomonadaceae bacterium]|nr:MBOAT family protein [Sphingomonadaceae bacterium]
MSFHSLDYLLFLPLVVLFYFATPHRWRWALLLLASNLFYASWRFEFLPLLWLTTCVDYLVARTMPSVRPGNLKRALLAVSLTTNLGMLLFFKYFALAANTWLAFTRPEGFTPVEILLPLGISFYTFQTLGYVIDVYRGRQQPERHLGYFAVYVMYFPQLLAGPIERATRILPQLREEHRFEARRAAAGGALILIGFFKKLVIADRLAMFVPQVMAHPADYSPLIVTAISFGSIYRYYADLSGYADIAIGSSLILGIRLAENFHRPLAAVSISQFWQRWHITVTNWFRDYVYLPIARGARGRWRRPLATILTIVIISFWHGAAWTWLGSGVVAGLLMVAEGAVRRNRRIGRTADAIFARLGMSERQSDIAKNMANRLVLWLFLVLLGSLVNAPTWRDAMEMWRQMGRLPLQLVSAPLDLTGAGLLQPAILFALLGIVALEIYQWFDVRRPVFDRLAARGRPIAWSFYYALIACIFVFGAFGTAQFIYFKF